MMDNRMMRTGREGNVIARRPRILLIALCIFFLAVVGAIILTAHDHGPDFPKADQAQSTEFQGIDSFIDSGLTTAQTNEMVKDFSKFSPKAKTVSVDPNSLSPGPHDPNLDQPFTINFNVSIDSTPYRGTVFYSGLDKLRLTLYSASGSPVFDSDLNH